MIIDTLSNVRLYHNLNKKIQSAFDFLQKQGTADLEPRKYIIDGDDVFALVQAYNTKPEAEGKWEAHRKYIDIQYVISGCERLGWANLNRLKITEPYSDENDVLFLEGQGDFLRAEAGTFLLFAPQDAHMPGIAVDRPAQVKKIVVKIRV
jgi:YhcH/YjgK/YiaL family protein